MGRKGSQEAVVEDPMVAHRTHALRMSVPGSCTIEVLCYDHRHEVMRAVAGSHSFGELLPAAACERCAAEKSKEGGAGE